MHGRYCVTRGDHYATVGLRNIYADHLELYMRWRGQSLEDSVERCSLSGSTQLSAPPPSSPSDEFFVRCQVLVLRSRH